MTSRKYNSTHLKIPVFIFELNIFIPLHSAWQGRPSGIPFDFMVNDDNQFANQKTPQGLLYVLQLFKQEFSCMA